MDQVRTSADWLGRSTRLLSLTAKRRHSRSTTRWRWRTRPLSLFTFYIQSKIRKITILNKRTRHNTYLYRTVKDDTERTSIVDHVRMSADRIGWGRRHETFVDDDEATTLERENTAAACAYNIQYLRSRHGYRVTRQRARAFASRNSRARVDIIRTSYIIVLYTCTLYIISYIQILYIYIYIRVCWQQRCRLCTCTGREQTTTI